MLASSLLCASSSSRTFHQRPAAHERDVVAQPLAASRAASTTASTSVSPDIGTWASRRPLAGSWFEHRRLWLQPCAAGVVAQRAWRRARQRRRDGGCGHHSGLFSPDVGCQSATTRGARAITAASCRTTVVRRSRSRSTRRASATIETTVERHERWERRRRRSHALPRRRSRRPRWLPARSTSGPSPRRTTPDAQPHCDPRPRSPHRVPVRRARRSNAAYRGQTTRSRRSAADRATRRCRPPAPPHLRGRERGGRKRSRAQPHRRR